MTGDIQHCQFIGYSDSGDYVYWEADLTTDGTNYHEWIVEELGEDRFQIWRIDMSMPASEIAYYRPETPVGGAEFESSGFAGAPRLRGPRANR